MMLALLLSMMSALAPGRDHARLADGIAEAIETEAPLFDDDESRTKTAAFLVAVAFRESSLRVDAVGDNGRARCAFQLWGAPRETIENPALCTRIAIGRIRESMRACGASNMLGTYAAGPTGCESVRARRISRDRMAVAQSLARMVRP